MTGWYADRTPDRSAKTVIAVTLLALRHAPARAPVTLEFLRGYPAAQLRTVARFTADLAAAPAPP